MWLAIPKCTDAMDKIVPTYVVPPPYTNCRSIGGFSNEQNIYKFLAAGNRRSNIPSSWALSDIRLVYSLLVQTDHNMALETAVLTAKQRFIDHVLQSTVLSLVIAFITYVVLNEFTRSRARVPGLGGPKGWPLIGNLWDIRSNAAEKYEEWSKVYGDVYQVQMGNVPVVVVNSAAATKTLAKSTG